MTMDIDDTPVLEPATSNLEDAYQSLRGFLHGRDTSDQARDELRSVLWLCAEAVERFGRSGRELRAIGDELTGVKTSDQLMELFDGSKR